MGILVGGRDGKTSLGNRMPGDPFCEERQHLLKIGRLRKSVIGPGNNVQALGAWQGVKEPLALMKWHIFIMIALNNQRWNSDLPSRLVSYSCEAVMIEG